jgi:hypothetical protein
MKGRKLTRTSIFLGQDQLERLREISEESGAPVAELARRALDSYLINRPGDHRRESCHLEAEPTTPETHGGGDTRIKRNAEAGNLVEVVTAHGTGHI